MQTGFGEAYLVGWLAFFSVFSFLPFLSEACFNFCSFIFKRNQIDSLKWVIVPYFSLSHVILIVPKFCHAGLLRVDGCST